MSTIIEREDNAFTVKELKEYLNSVNEDLPVNICVMQRLDDVGGSASIFSLESMSENGEKINLTGYNT
jgi:hypothetical protein